MTLNIFEHLDPRRDVDNYTRDVLNGDNNTIVTLLCADLYVKKHAIRGLIAGALLAEVASHALGIEINGKDISHLAGIIAIIDVVQAFVRTLPEILSHR